MARQTTLADVAAGQLWRLPGERVYGWHCPGNESYSGQRYCVLENAMPPRYEWFALTTVVEVRGK